MNLDKELLRLLVENARLTNAELARRLGRKERAVAAAVAAMEQSGLIRGYRALLDPNRGAASGVQALIEVKVRPEREGGFDRIAQRLAKFPEVASVYLVSGGYDLMLEVRGKTLQEVAAFVASKLATIEGVTSTTTHFLLKKYKENSVCFAGAEQFERLKVTP
jgi:DNA-binding Lrp family transcriptional regulator